VYGLISTHGTVCFARLAERGDGRRWASRHDPDGSDRMELGGTAGFVFDRERGGFIVGVPYWLACSLLASLPAFRWRRRGPTAGLCSACGYDLRATPDRCPECGAIAGAAGEQVGGARTGVPRSPISSSTPAAPFAVATPPTGSRAR